MADRFLSLSQADRRDVLEPAPGRGLERAPYLLEKDVWVVWTLEALFAAPFADGLVFKGGTSLSKAYDVIDRFSEDVDLTYDIGKLTGDTRFGDLRTRWLAKARSLQTHQRKLGALRCLFEGRGRLNQKQNECELRGDLPHSSSFRDGQSW